METQKLILEIEPDRHDADRNSASIMKSSQRVKFHVEKAKDFMLIQTNGEFNFDYF